MIRKTKENFWVIDRDTHFTKWVEESRKLDHDEYILNSITPYLGNNSIIDIGANIGTHTYFYSKRNGAKNVIAIEPNLECVECLSKNIPDCNIITSAVSDKDGEALFLLNNENIGASYFTEGQGTKTIKLDNYIDYLLSLVENKSFSFIKMDIEGYEVKALRGMEKLISTYKPNMLIEVNLGALQRAGTSEEELIELVKSYGYFYKALPYPSIQYDIICY